MFVDTTVVHYAHKKPFNWKNAVQVLVVIRHGESEHNAAQTKSQGWSDPKLFDPSLTAKGCQQARHLRQELIHEMQHNKYITAKDASVLWVTSPLRRCLQTFLLSCPLLPATAADHSAYSGQKAVGQQLQEKLSAMHCHGLPPVRVVRYVWTQAAALFIRCIHIIDMLRIHLIDLSHHEHDDLG